ncbi:unnamed protein product [Ambrosiozyma monospora]|uniref:Unnamed protein product n=1 Tax=Ambrosiozyma monospora TaxID=43982 RepID=A0A9W6YZ73_AMBMO|nr:unnamed protein product [Ambrosiozyma monospora]
MRLFADLLDTSDILNLENATGLKKLNVSFNKGCQGKTFRPFCKSLHELVINIQRLTVQVNLSGVPNMKKLTVFNGTHDCFRFGIGRSVEDLVLKDFYFSSSETFNLPASLKSLDVSGINLQSLGPSETLANISTMRTLFSYLFNLDSVISIMPARISTLFIEFPFKDNLTIDLALFPLSIESLYLIDPRGITILVSFQLRDLVRAETSRINLSQLPGPLKIGVDLSAVEFDLSTSISIEQTKSDCEIVTTLPEADIDSDKLQIWKHSDSSSDIEIVRNASKVQEGK